MKKRYLLRVMRLLVLFLLAGLIHVSAATYSQSVTLRAVQWPLADVMQTIRQQTGYAVYVNLAHLEGAKPVSIDAKDMPLEKFLAAILRDQPLEAKVEDKTILVKERAATRSDRNPATGFRQQIVSGTVTDESGNPVAGVTITISGKTTTPVRTDREGRFSVPDVSGNETMLFSHVGYRSQTVSIAGRSTLQVVLHQEVMDEVVVIGYGTVARKDLTGSVGSVKMADLQQAPVRSFEEALAGRVAGVQVTSVDGQPGSDINIVIRGSNSITGSNAPLYVIDGFPIEDPDNNAINPDDIESIEVLKDASATAIYGSRAANGVVIITTKSGKEGLPVISYNGSYGTQEVLQRMEVLDAYEFVRYQLERQPAVAELQYLTEDRPDLESYRNVEGVDWQSQIFQVAPMHNHSLAIRGGTKTTQYALSGNILQQDGVIISSGYNRYQGRLRLDQEVSKNLSVSANINYSRMTRFGESPIPPSGVSQPSSHLMYSVWGYRPVTGRVNDDLLDTGIDDDVDLINDLRFNPVKNYVNSLREQAVNLLSANGHGEYTWKDFTLRVSGGMTHQVTKGDAFYNTQTSRGSPLARQGAERGINGSVTYFENVNFLNENTLSYKKRLKGGHSVNALGGVTIQGRNVSSFGATAYHLPNEGLGISGLDEGMPQAINSTSSRQTLASVLGRVNYAYKSKYLATASFRADGSSKFPLGNKWGYFPSGALSWRLSREPFMQSVKAISDAKVRASIGLTGNNRVSDFAYMSTLTVPTDAGYPFDNALSKGVEPTVLGNDRLLWESTLQTDLGVDVSLFDNRIHLTADVYRKTTFDLLLNAQLPTSLGFTSTFKNIGKVQNQGLELSLETTNIQAADFRWTSAFNIAFNRNKVLELTQNQESMPSPMRWAAGYQDIPAYIARIGYPIGMFYGLLWEGNYQLEDFDVLPSGGYALLPQVPTNGNSRANIQPGHIKYKDINEDGMVNLSDYTMIGNPNPLHIGGFANNFHYKGVDLHVFFQWSYGNEVYNANRILFEGGGQNAQNMFATYLNRWSPENPNNEYYATGGAGPIAYSNRVVEDGSFLRLKTVSVGYNFPASLLRAVRLKSVRAFVSAQNLYTWHNYQGYDPEVSAFNSALTPAFDWSVYPRASTVTFGLNLTL